MDFRTCPACKASVLEDDVTDCPFCGASMSGKPKAAAPKPTPAAGPAKSPAVAAPAAAAGPPARPAGPAAHKGRGAPQPEVEMEDPFDVDTTAVRRAIKLAPKPTKQRTHEVVCPMCETHGFMPLSEAGKDVQCCNPQCIVPVFKSKRVMVEEAKPETPARNWPLLIGGGSLAALVLGGAAFLLWPAPPPAVVIEPIVKPTEDTGPVLIPGENTIVEAVQAPASTVEEVRAQSLERILEFAQHRNKNRSADYGAELAADTFARAGDPARAAETLGRIKSSLPHFRAAPLVEIGWRQLQKGDAAALDATLADLIEKSRGLPKTVRRSHDTAMNLAALLLAAGRDSDADAVINAHAAFDDRGELSTLWVMSILGETFNVDTESQLPWHAAMPDPMRIGVAELLVARGHTPIALKFVNRLTGQTTRSVARAAAVGRLVLREGSAATPRLAEWMPADLDPAEQCAARAALAAAWQQRGDADAAREQLALAQGLLGQLPAGAPIPLPSMKEIYDSEGKKFLGLPDPQPAHTRALAALHVAVAQLLLGEREAAWGTFQKAHELARGMSPSAALTQALVEECSRSKVAVEARLRPLVPRNDMAFYRYQRQCIALDADADARLNLQARFLRRAALGGLLDAVAAFAESVETAPGDLRDPVLNTDQPLARLLLALAQAEGNSAVAARLNARKPGLDPIDDMFARARAAIAAGNFDPATEAVRLTYTRDEAKKQPSRIDDAVLRLTGMVQSSADIAKCIEFVQGLGDPVIQEDAFLLLAGGSVARQQAPELWRFATTSNDLDALEQAAILRGFILAIPAPGTAGGG